MSEQRENVKKAFIDATVKTFSEMAFVDVAYKEEAQEPIEYNQVNYLAFQKPPSGFAALYMPIDCKKLIVENIYGEDWQNLPPDQVDDCLLELLNVLVGNYLSGLYGDAAPRDIGLPRLMFDDSEVGESSAAEILYFDAEGVGFKAVLEHNGV